MHLFVHLLVFWTPVMNRPPSCQDCAHFVNRRCRLFGPDPDKPPATVAEMEYASASRKNPDQCGPMGDFFQEHSVWKKLI